MEKWLRLVTRDIVIIDTMALIVVATGTAEAFFTGLWAACPASRASRKFRESLVCYGRWLVAGLTFQLAAAQERMSLPSTASAPSVRSCRAPCDWLLTGTSAVLSTSSGNTIRLSWTDEAHTERRFVGPQLNPALYRARGVLFYPNRSSKTRVSLRCVNRG